MGYRVYCRGEETNYDFSAYRDFESEAQAREFNSREGYALEPLAPLAQIFESGPAAKRFSSPG